MRLWPRKITAADLVRQIEVLSVKKDDLVLVTVPVVGDELHMKTRMEACRDIFRDALRGKGADVLVIPKGVSVQLVRSAEAKLTE